jgi:hypothetical protein
MLIADENMSIGRKTMKATLLLLMGSMFSLPLASDASADPANIKSKSLNVDSVYQQNIVRVISRGHEKFDAIEDGGNIKLWVRGHVDPKGLGRVYVGGFLLGLLDLSRFNAAPSSHLSSYLFESQWAFPT